MTSSALGSYRPVAVVGSRRLSGGSRLEAVMGITVVPHCSPQAGMQVARKEAFAVEHLRKTLPQQPTCCGLETASLGRAGTRRRTRFGHPDRRSSVSGVHLERTRHNSVIDNH